MNKIIALLLGSFLLGSTLAMAANEKKPQLRVQLMIFSGRPDPEFVIDDPKDVAQLKHLLHQLPKGPAAAQGKSVSPDKLGYTGFRVLDLTDASGEPASFVVYGSAVELPAGKGVHHDAGRAVERLLLDLGKAKGAIDERMEKRVKGEK